METLDRALVSTSMPYLRPAESRESHDDYFAQQNDRLSSQSSMTSSSPSYRPSVSSDNSRHDELPPPPNQPRNGHDQFHDVDDQRSVYDEANDDAAYNFDMGDISPYERDAHPHDRYAYALQPTDDRQQSKRVHDPVFASYGYGYESDSDAESYRACSAFPVNTIDYGDEHGNDRLQWSAVNERYPSDTISANARNVCYQNAYLI